MEIEPGHCHCGCGQETPIANWTNKRTGSVKGQPSRFVRGHQNRKAPAPEGTHYCAKHEAYEPAEGFKTKPGGLLDSWCMEARREHGREYSKAAYAERKAEVARGREEREARTHQVCTKCQVKKPIEAFPFRTDEGYKDKRKARCKKCWGEIQAPYQAAYNDVNRDAIRENKRDYRRRKPEKHREAGRRRRARKREVRREKYSDVEIRSRDQGLCHFCGEFVDPSLVYPDPGSQTIHHIYPLEKRGPDAPANVRVAHNRCNNKWHNRYDNPFADPLWTIQEISHKLARETVIEHHYLHRGSNTSFTYGLYYDQELMGVVIFGSPSSRRISTSVCPQDPNSVIELNRLWISPSAPHCAATWFVSRVFKRLPPRIVVSYADTGASDPRNGRAHDGTVYRALSLDYAGLSKPSKDWRLPGSTRNVGKKTPGSEPVVNSPKRRFWTVTGDKREKRTLRALVCWPSLFYDE